MPALRPVLTPAPQIVAKEVISQLEALGHSVVRVYSGHMMTSLEMAGVLVSLLRVTAHPQWEVLLDAATAAPAWPVVLGAAGGGQRSTPARVAGEEQVAELEMVKGARLGEEGERRVKAALEGLTAELVKLESRLNELDSGSGDGDCGATLAAGARAIQAALPSLSLAHPLALLHELASLAESMGGSSGGLYSILLTAASRAFRDQVTATQSWKWPGNHVLQVGGEVEAGSWVRGLRLGLEAVMKYGAAQAGDRTMVRCRLCVGIL